MTGQWPLQDFLEFGALPGAVPCARLHARQLIWEWGLTALTDSVEILVSELVTNAVHAARSLELPSPVRLWLLSDKAQVLILVWDASPQSPARVDADDEAESGRGLLLVETISDQWGSFPARETGGKAVWAVVTQ
jgi:anti-sigma regulatory factor (Ser/Thr protein kinase)